MKRMLLLTIALPLACLAGAGDAAVELAAARTEVAIAENAPQTVVFAAGEMTNFLSRVFGVRIPLVRKPTPGKYALFLGDSPEVRAAGIDVGQLPHDGFEVCVTADAAYIAGADDPEQDLVRIAARQGPNGVHGAHATLFGTYDFLERFAGCRFYFPGRLGEIVPRAATLRLPKGRYRSAPSFTLRRFSVMDKNFGVWPARDKISDAEWRRATNLEVYRLRMETEHIPFCHGQSKIRLSERFAGTHPEWFALTSGKRRTTWDKNKPSSSSQMCITSGYWEEIYQDARSYLSGEPASIRKPARGKVRRNGKLVEDWVWLWHAKGRKYFDVMPNDGMAKCQCENCRAAYAKAKDPKNGWATEVVWGKTAEMARRLSAEGIGGYLTQMAYGPYSGVPDFEMPTNVLVMLARTGAWSVANKAKWERENELVKKWSAKLNGNLVLWNYPGKYDCAGTNIPDVPSGTPHAMGAYLKSVAPFIKGTYQESETDRFFFNYLALYVFSRVAWDSSVDPEAVIAEHDRLMFGSAAAKMHEYILAQENIWLTNVVGNVMYSSLGPKIAPPAEYELWTRVYGEETMRRLGGLLDAAEAEAGVGTLAAERVALYRAETYAPLAARRKAYLESIDPARERAYREEHPGSVASNIVSNGEFAKGFSGWRRNTSTKSALCDYDPSDGVFGDGCMLVKAEEDPEARSWRATWRAHALQFLEGRRALKPSTRYRLSYFVKLDNVVPLAGRGGVAAAVFEGNGSWRFLPERKLRGTIPWIRQVFVFETGPEADVQKERPHIRLAISAACGEARFDGVSLEELGPAGGKGIAAISPAPYPARSDVCEVPFSALRFGYRYTQPDKWPEMRAALEKNRAAFDEVWFSTGVSFPPLSWHEEHARQCAAAAEDLRSLGIVPSIEIQTIIGHTDAILESGDCTGQNWGRMVSADGLAAKRLSCPRDPNLVAYFTRVAALHAAWRPGSMWVDDDLSYRNRAPLLNAENNLPGCFCDKCLAGFEKAEGRTWARAELTRQIRVDEALRKRWDDYSCAGFAELTRAIALSVHRISPETTMGYQYGGALRSAIPKGLFKGCGRPVRLRPGAGAYWDSDPHQQLDKAYTLQQMLCGVREENWIGACCPEIETCPRTFACRTAQGIILEAFENLALGMDFVSLFVADARTDETTAFYSDCLFPRLAAAHPFLKGYHEANAGTRPCGFTVPGGIPARLVACRGVPIVGDGGRSWGELPDVASIAVRMAGSGNVDRQSPAYQTRVMQIASSTGLSDYYARCDRASGGRLSVVFERPVMAFVMPRVRSDGTLATLAILNASIDLQDSVRVRLRGVPSDVTSGVWWALHERPVTLQIERQGSDAVVTVPALAAWNCGWLHL